MADGLKDRNLQDYYESMIAMFSTAGWKYLSEDLAKIHDEANTLRGVSNEWELAFRLGQVDILTKVIAQPVVIPAAYDLLLAGEDTA